MDARRGIWVVMELCELGSLRDTLRLVAPRGSGLDESTVGAVLHEVLQGLAYLHNDMHTCASGH